MRSHYDPSDQAKWMGQPPRPDAATLRERSEHMRWPWPVPEGHIEALHAQAKGRRAAELEHAERRKRPDAATLREQIAKALQDVDRAFDTSTSGAGPSVDYHAYAADAVMAVLAGHGLVDREEPDDAS